MIEFEAGITSEIMLQETNRCINEMLEFELSSIETDGEQEEFLDLYFPQYLCRENPKKCLNILLELKEWTQDLYYHKLTPLHEYALFKIFKAYFEMAEECEKNREEGEENPFRFKFSHVKNCTKEDWDSLKILNYPDFYKVELFQDWDFLSVEEIASRRQRGEPLDKMMGVNLSEYLELMPQDIRNEISEILETEEKIYARNEDEKIIINQIKNAILIKERNPERLLKISEDELSDDIKDLSKPLLEQNGIIIEREARGGFAKNSVGENDFFLQKIENGKLIQLAIGENKLWNNFEKQIKQLIGYMNENIKFGFTIVFNKTEPLKIVRYKQIKIFEKLFKENETEIIEVGIDEDDNLISIHKNPENDEIYKIYHLIVNAYHPERKELAKQARK